MGEKRMGRQTPTESVVLPYADTKGGEAIELYNQSGRTALEWQVNLVNHIMAVNKDGLWTHQEFGYSVPRRNGKNEVVAIRELWGLTRGEQMCHTAHRTTTSSAAWRRLCKILSDAGYTEVTRIPKDKGKLPEKWFHSVKQYGLEAVEIPDTGGRCVFRTRTPSGGLGEGFDLMVIDEAQEYTDTQQTALVYTVSDSKNPQTLLCGTPPTVTSSGTVFVEMREETLAGGRYDAGWAEWSIPEQTDDVFNTELWYETNPSMGAHLNERKVRAEFKGDKIDFNIQRLGVWLRYNQKSAITETEWSALKVDKLPKLSGKLFAGIKYGRDGLNVVLSIAVKTEDDKTFVESVDCRPIRDGNRWLLAFLKAADIEEVIIDGAGQDTLVEDMKSTGVKVKTILPKVGEVVEAHRQFEQSLTAGTVCHMGQPSLVQSVTNCEHRPIGTGGGWGYKTQKEGIEVALLESVVLANWRASAVKKAKKKQRVSY